MGKLHRIVGTVALSFLLCTPWLSLGQESSSRGYHKPIKSLRELRSDHVLRQKWDLSCGAAAIGTLLTYDYQTPVSETEAVVWILHRTDPVKVQSRGGFSLLDLKRFAKFRGFDSDGYAELTLQELVDLKRPAIVPIRVKGFDHFVVFRGVAGDRIVMADPAFGNLTMTTERFLSQWKGGIAFVLATSPTGRNKPPYVVAPLGTDVYRTSVDTAIGGPSRLNR